MLCFSSGCLIYFIIGLLYCFIPFAYSAHLPSHFPVAIISLFSVFMSQFLFCVCLLVCFI